MSIAKITELLEQSSNKKVSTITDELMALVSGLKRGVSATVVRDSEGAIFAVYCYYHKKWELMASCEYGAKKSTASGLNSMCKEGVSNWTRQQRLAKKAKESLIDQLIAEEIQQSELVDLQAKIEADRAVIVPREDGHGMDEEPVC